MITIADALELIDSTIEPLDAVEVPVGEALGRVPVEELTAASSVPSFRQSAMDGYGLRADDVAGASEESPTRLTVVGERAAGRVTDLPSIGKGEAIRIFTGAAVPEDVDAIVRQEKVRRDGDEVVVEQPVSAGNDIRPIGESLDAGALIGKAGERLRAGTIGRAAMTGIDRVSARKRPDVAVFVTGNEVRPAGADLKPGELYDANSPFLSAWLAERDIFYRLRQLPDDRDEVADAIGGALDAYDLVVTSGGVSVGDYDYVAGTAEEVGLEEVFWKIRQRPGKPVWFGHRDGTPLLGLPGNPGAVYVGGQVYLQRVIDALEGVVEPEPNWREGRLTAPVSRKSSKATLAGARVEIDDEAVVRVTPELGHQSHRMARLSGAKALVWIPEGEGELDAGATVRWIPTG